jgi:S-adenosylmethionine synthetase
MPDEASTRYSNGAVAAMTTHRLFTSSSVLSGHPDKLCDRISDAIVDAHLTLDLEARVRAETAAAGQVIFVATDARTRAQVDISGIVRATLAETRYDVKDLDPTRCAILAQSSTMLGPWTSSAVSQDPLDAPALEQTTVFGYACTETPELMPLPIRLAHRLAKALDSLALARSVPGLGPDGSVQVTIEYEDDTPMRIDAMVFQLLHKGDPADLREVLSKRVIGPLVDTLPIGPDDRTRVIINAEGPLTVGGPARNAGHTGRKQAADTYGGAARQGDGALSGKDPSRLDRCAAYAARHAAKNVIAAGLATECELLLSYTIGQAQPTTVYARTFGRGRISNDELSSIIGEVFDFRPAAIAQRFRLWSLPRERGGRFYRELAVGGQLGRTDLDLPWEACDAVEELHARVATRPLTA